MKTREIRQLDFSDLQEQIKDKREEIGNLKFQHSLHQLDNTLKVRLARRELARMLTIYREHQLGVRRLTEVTSEPIMGGK